MDKDIKSIIKNSINTIYRGKATNVALVLVVLGILLIMEADNFPETKMWHHVVRDLGIAALISGVLGTAYEYALRGDFNKQTKGVLNELLEERESELQRMRKAGMWCIHENRDQVELDARFQTSSETIQILETWHGYGVRIRSWIKKAVERGCTVKILLLNPTSRQVQYREQALSVPTDHVKNKIVEDLNDLEALCRELKQTDGHISSKGKLEIRTYDATPVMHMYRFDNTWITGMYFNEDSTDSPQFEVVKPTPPKPVNAGNGSQSTFDFAQQLENHFNGLWAHKQTKSASEALKEAEKQRRKKRRFQLGGVIIPRKRAQ